jgi:hypothetical protein
MTPITTVVVAFHESGHAIGLLALRRRIAVVWVEDDLSGRCECREKRAPMPEWHTLAAAFECGSDLVGVIAGARCKDQQVRDDDDDIVRWGGFDDLENFKRKAAVLTDDDPAKIADLRRRSWDVASQLTSIYWRSITEIATDLHVRKRLFHDDVLAAVRRAGDDDRLLRGEQPSAMAAVVPVRALTTHGTPQRSLRTGHVTLKDIGGGAVVAIYADGRRRPFDNIYRALYAIR